MLHNLMQVSIFTCTYTGSGVKGLEMNTDATHA